MIRKYEIKKRRNRGRDKKKYKLILGLILALCLIGVSVFVIFMVKLYNDREKPIDILTEYMNCIPAKEYEKMYSMLDIENSVSISQENFILRNSAIYEGIELQNMKVDAMEYDEERLKVKYHTSFDTVAGNISFDNAAYFYEGEEGYKLIWNDALIFPELESTDKVRISRIDAQRGNILDRNDGMLAGKGTASSVGIVPGKLKEREKAITEIAELLEIKPESIEKKLEAKWVKEDSFVPIKTVTKISEIELISPFPKEWVVAEQERQEKLLAVSGVMISDIEVRGYPLNEAAAHLIGYVQNVTAEDLEKHPGEGYTSNSVIGRSGMEGLYEKELKGQDGYLIYISDSEGNSKKELASLPVQNGIDIKLTIDIGLQKELYEQFQEDKSCSVAMNPYTGEVLALVSTPAFNNNDFILGMSDQKWSALEEDERKPLYNRFRQTFSPGSALKPITAAIGLQTGAIKVDEDFGNEGLSWQKDSSWGLYKVTTLHTYEPVILENALIYSDNIYFAKAALRIGAEELKTSLQKLGFSEKIPFEITMASSQYSNTDKIETEIQLADSGYGQGQVLVNPLHLASLYTSFLNQGNIVKPYLRYKKEAEPEIWIPEAFSSDVSNQVLEGLKQVINHPQGTGYAAHQEDIILAGKTGTAEIKASKEDTSGTELGWFSVFTAEPETEKPILIISMVEDVKDRGGSGYVVEKDTLILENWIHNN